AWSFQINVEQVSLIRPTYPGDSTPKYIGPAFPSLRTDFAAAHRISRLSGSKLTPLLTHQLLGLGLKLDFVCKGREYTFFQGDVH
ncbi:hypothetical protein, partial [Azohydromonas lata]|uniref:hypothetical protein n=1 Tax=Azohydromonas lata TaxID=45677 RepID=UPI001C3F33F8